MKLAKYRRIAQVFFLLVFLILFLQARYPYDATTADLFLRMSPLMPLFDFIAHFRISLLFWPALAILLLTPFMGRVFCGWICPLGTTIDASSHLLKSPKGQKDTKWDRLRPVKFGILAGSIMLALFSINVWGYFDPISIFNRALTAIIYPLATLGTSSIILGVANVPLFEEPTYAVYDWFKALIMPEHQSNLQQIFWIALLFGTIMGLEKVTRRFWCRYLCPAGAFLGVISKFRFLERKVDNTCTDCMLCVKDCKMNAIPEGDVVETSKVECIECFSCQENCPPKLGAIRYGWSLKPYQSKVDYSRRQFIQTTFTSFAALGLLGIGLKNKSAADRTIRPPGSLPEDEFLTACIRCLECVRICQSNGRCLQPDGIHNSALELWAPVAVMRSGYCEYNCNLCGQVCPTDAILPLSLEQKKTTPMGLAYFDKNLCIPFAKYEECIVCEEHCPISDKAIKLEIKDVTLPDGSTKLLKHPYMVKERCTGCGICETKCPLPGAPGIFVTIEGQVRPTPDMVS
ncbi:4Fe-4S binding protein [Candidatus Neomarinimicrobiota bacterium]